MLSWLLDIQRVGQYFTQVNRVRDVVAAAGDDWAFLTRLRRGLLPLPTDRRPEPYDPFPASLPRTLPRLAGRRVAVVSTGGSGALASLLGVVRVLEEAGVQPVAYAACSGSALFGLPLAAGLPAGEVARAVLGLQPADYLDPDWPALARLPLALGRGWTGLLRGDRLEQAMRSIVGDVTLGDLPTPLWVPVWNVEENRLAFLGPDRHPEIPAARAVRMAMALPLAMQPVPMDGGYWLDGGIVEILPAEPFLRTDRCDVAIVVNCFYPPGFAAQQERDWQRRRFSVVRMSAQTRLMQHIRLAQQALAALRQSAEVILVEPVPYHLVQGAGLYGQFLDNRDWARFMLMGYRAAAQVLAAG